MSSGPRAGEGADVADAGALAAVLLVTWLGGMAIYSGVLLTQRSDALAHWIMLVVGWSVAAFLVVRRRHLQVREIEVTSLISYAGAAIIIAAGRDSATPYSYFFLWLVALDFHVLPPRRAMWHIPAASASAFAAFALCGGGFPWFRWILLTATVGVVGGSVGILRMRIDKLVARLADSARTDPLTNMPNRRSFDEALEVQLGRSARSGENLALLLADLDHFKLVNDRFGHLVGDDVLRRAAQAISETVRRIDVATRVGGEEFAVILPATDEARAHTVAERVRHAVSAAFEGDAVAVTVSIGVAVYPVHAVDGRDPHRRGRCRLLLGQGPGPRPDGRGLGQRPVRAPAAAR